MRPFRPMEALRAMQTLPVESLILIVPITYALSTMGIMVYHTIRNDPDQSKHGMRYYTDEVDDELSYAARYHDNPVRKFFESRLKGRRTWGVFENEVMPSPK